MNKKTTWILVIVGVLLIVLVVLAKTGAFGKEDGTKVTAALFQR